MDECRRSLRGLLIEGENQEIGHEARLLDRVELHGEKAGFFAEITERTGRAAMRQLGALREVQIAVDRRAPETWDVMRIDNESEDEGSCVGDEATYDAGETKEELFGLGGALPRLKESLSVGGRAI